MTDDSRSRLGKYLTDGERIVVATHRHWFCIAEPLGTATLSLLLIAIAFAAGAPVSIIEFLLVAWLVVFVRSMIRVWEWNMEWFIATDQRLLLVYGFIIRKVDMLPMSKVTDMTFRRSVMGRLFGYGTFVLESAGQDQALSDLHFIPDPNETYLKIVATIFKTGDPDELAEDVEEVRSDLDDTRPAHEARDPWDDDDPTERFSLRSDLAHLGRKHGKQGKKARRGSRRQGNPSGYHDDVVDPDDLAEDELDGFTMGSIGTSNPVDERRRHHLGKRDPDYARTLYSSLGSEQFDPWDEQDHGPHVRKRSWWRR